MEFRERQLFAMSCFPRAQILEHCHSSSKAIMLQRAKLGPRYHAGIRQVLKRIFHLYDTSGGGDLSPEEWIGAQKVVATEIMDDIDEGWVDEAAFTAMDTNGDGRLQLNEYMDASFSMFEGVKMHSEQIFLTLERVCNTLESRRSEGVQQTLPVSIFIQQGSAAHTFQPPHSAWQDEPTEANFAPKDFHWKLGDTVELPLNLQTVDEVSSLLRLLLQLPADTWLSIFFVGICKYGGAAPIMLLKDNQGTGNVQATLEWLAKPNAVHRLYVKNIRKRPSKLFLQPKAFLDERAALLARRTGQLYGLDWETQLVGEGRKLPGAIEVSVGDALLIEVPKTDDSGEFTYVSSVYTDGINVLSRPLDENIVAPKRKKKKKAKKQVEVEEVPNSDDSDEQEAAESQLTFVALQPGRCVLFIDVSWEDQETKLAGMHEMCAPVSENSIARIGPVEVLVLDARTANKGGHLEQRLGQEKKKGHSDKGILWWNGDKWSYKKGSGVKAKAKAKS